MSDNVVSPCGDQKLRHGQANDPVCNYTDAVPAHHACSIYYIHLSLTSSLQGESPASLFSVLQEEGTVFYLPELNTLPVLDEYAIGTNYVFYHILFAVPVHTDAHALVDVLTPLGKVQTELLGVTSQSNVKVATGYFSQFVLSSQGQQVTDIVAGLSDLMAPLFVIPEESVAAFPSDSASFESVSSVASAEQLVEPAESVEPNDQIEPVGQIELVEPVESIKPAKPVQDDVRTESETVSAPEAATELHPASENYQEPESASLESAECEDRVEKAFEDPADTFFITQQDIEYFHTGDDCTTKETVPCDKSRPSESDWVAEFVRDAVVSNDDALIEDSVPAVVSIDDSSNTVVNVETVVVPKYVPPALDRMGQSAKLDTLVSRVSEIAGMQTRLYDYALAQSDDMLRSMAEELDHLYGTLRDSALDLRMVALEPLLVSLGDWAAEYAQAYGKTFSFEVSCEEAQIDSEVADSILEALAVYFEQSLEKVIAQDGVCSVSVKITAEYAGADVLLLIEHEGLVHADPSLEIPDAFLSLQSSVLALHGAMAVAYGDDQHVVIKVNLPITQAMIEGLLVQCGDDQYVVPMNQLAECVDCNPRMGVEAKDNKIILGGTPVPCLRLREVLGLETSKVENEQCLVIQSLSGTFALIVDGIAGELQTAVKSIGPLYSHLEMYTGASVKPDGTLALVLNLQHFQVVADCLIVGA